MNKLLFGSIFWTAIQMNSIVRVYMLILLSAAVLFPAEMHAQTVCDEDIGITTKPDAAGILYSAPMRIETLLDTFEKAGLVASAKSLRRLFPE